MSSFYAQDFGEVMILIWRITLIYVGWESSVGDNRLGVSTSPRHAERQRT